MEEMAGCDSEQKAQNKGPGLVVLGAWLHFNNIKFVLHNECPRDPDDSQTDVTFK